MSEGYCELLARFYASHHDLRAHTRVYVPQGEWDARQQRLSIPRRGMNERTIQLTEIQRRIDDLKAFIMDAYFTTGVTDKLWLERTVDAFHNIQRHAPVPLADMVERYMEAREVTGGTAGQYRVVERMLRRFDQARGAVLMASDVTPADIEAFAAFLRYDGAQTGRRPAAEAKRSQNTVNSKLKRVRAVCRYAVEIGAAAESPFDRYKIPADVYGTPTFLTMEERDALYRASLGNAALEVQRDIFVFQCHVGCRVSDLVQLKADNVTPDGFLQYIQRKVRRTNPVLVRVPLSPTAAEIIERYRGKTRGGMLLPFISPQKYNESIKEVLRAAGITRLVLVQNKRTYEDEPRRICDIAASHLARRTFMGNMFKRVRSERIVSAFTGHAAGSRAFSRYTDVDDELKLSIISEMEGGKK